MRLLKGSVAYGVFYAVGVIVMSALGLLPRRARLLFCRALGNIWWLFDAPNRRLMAGDMKIALGRELSRARREQAVRRSMEGLITHASDAYYGRRFRNGSLFGLVLNTEWRDEVESALERGRGAIVLTAHFGNGVMLYYLFGAIARSTCLARYQRVFNSFLVRHRLRMNVATLIETENSYFRMLGCLKRNEVILATFDRPSKHIPGVRTTMFGRTVVTPYYFVDLARVAQAPIFIMFLVRERDRYRMYSEGPFFVPSEGDLRRAREHYAQAAVSVLEKYVRLFPEQWNWGQKKFSKSWGRLRYPGRDASVGEKRQQCPQ
jgi:lauroyl/myristoyl acyltransferase